MFILAFGGLFGDAFRAQGVAFGFWGTIFGPGGRMLLAEAKER